MTQKGPQIAKQIVQPEPAVMSVPVKLVKDPLPVLPPAPVPVPVVAPLVEQSSTVVDAAVSDPAAPVIEPVVVPSAPPTRVLSRPSTSIYRANVAELSVIDVYHIALLCLASSMRAASPAGPYWSSSSDRVARRAVWDTSITESSATLAR